MQAGDKWAGLNPLELLWSAEWKLERKPRVWFDTYVINHLFADDIPERKQDIARLRVKCRASKLNVVFVPMLILRIVISGYLQSHPRFDCYSALIGGMGKAAVIKD